jgi:hypothetical protein
MLHVIHKSMLTVAQTARIYNAPPIGTRPIGTFPLPGLRGQVEAIALAIRDGISSGDIRYRDALSLIGNITTEVEQAEVDIARVWNACIQGASA